jgi:hypothetical protein
MVFSDSESTGHTFFSYIPLFHMCNFIFFYLLIVNLHGNEDSLQDSIVLLYLGQLINSTGMPLFGLFHWLTLMLLFICL